jgi:V/A-type H+-transporting ATPase subunit B
MNYANQFESRYVSQGYQENRTIEQTLNLGWELLSMFEDGELKRIDEELIKKYMPQFRKKQQEEAGEQSKAETDDNEEQEEETGGESDESQQQQEDDK